MRQLNFDLKTPQARHREGAFIQRQDCARALDQAANLLHALGFRRLRAAGLKRKHVDALVAEWQRRGLATGTVNPRCRIQKIILKLNVEKMRPHLITMSVHTLRRCARLPELGWEAGIQLQGHVDCHRLGDLRYVAGSRVTPAPRFKVEAAEWRMRKMNDLL